MTEEERIKLTRSNYAAQMAMLGYNPDGNPKTSESTKTLIENQARLINDLGAKLKEQQIILRFMFNRCEALTQGTICGICVHRDVCEKIRTICQKVKHED